MGVVAAGVVANGSLVFTLNKSLYTVPIFSISAKQCSHPQCSLYILLLFVLNNTKLESSPGLPSLAPTFISSYPKSTQFLIDSCDNTKFVPEL